MLFAKNVTVTFNIVLLQIETVKTSSSTFYMKSSLALLKSTLYQNATIFINFKRLLKIIFIIKKYDKIKF